MPRAGAAIHRVEVRARCLLLFACLGLGLGIGLGIWPGQAMAQELRASGAAGAGVFGTRAAAAADLGIEVTGSDYAMSLGARLRWVSADGLRTEDWDEPSEWAALLRYLIYQRPPGQRPPGDHGDHGDAIAVSAAAGALGNADLGHGALIRGYTTGLDLDHRRVGAQVRVAGARWQLEGLVDDLVAPRVAGVHVAWQRAGTRHALEAGLSVAADLSAPEHMGADAIVLPMAALESRARVHTADQRLAGAVHADLAAIGTVAGGLHLGASFEALLAGARVSARAELQLGMDGYVGGWVGPLYERDRGSRDQGIEPRTQLDMARAGGLGHVGSAFAAAAHHPALGELDLSYARRPGLPDLAVARVAAPHFRQVQGALWAAVEHGGRGGNSDAMAAAPARVLALELRAALPRDMFVTVEAARLYRSQALAEGEQGLTPWWLATASLGAVLSP